MYLSFISEQPTQKMFHFLTESADLFSINNIQNLSTSCGIRISNYILKKWFQIIPKDIFEFWMIFPIEKTALSLIMSKTICVGSSAVTCKVHRFLCILYRFLNCTYCYLHETNQKIVYSYSWLSEQPSVCLDNIGYCY